MLVRNGGSMRAWLFSLMMCGVAFGCSSGSSTQFGGQDGGVGQPGCTKAPDCGACTSCLARCYCQTGLSSCANSCSSGTGGSGTGGSGTGGSGTGGSGATGTGGSSTGGSSTGGSSTGGSSTGGSSTGGSSTGGSSTGGSGTGGSTSDPFAAARQTCVDHINQLRATKNRTAYTRWTSIESCVDGEATYDSTHGPHAAFIGHVNTCGEHSQGECPGQGPSTVTNCIDLMWAEKDQSICSGCDSCPSMQQCFAGNCPNCLCSTGHPTCGHYMALIDPTQTMVACGFSTGSPYTTLDYR